MFDLTGKCALVTGASGGIGAEIAKALHAQGATVGLTGTRVEALEKVAAEIGEERVHILPCNLSDDEALAALPKQASDAMGSLDILVNNAGLTRDNLAMRLKEDDWDAVLNVNLTAAFKLSKAVLRGMMKKRWGRIIGITSIVGVTGNPGQTNYAASKAGMIGYSKSLAYEVGSRGITVNCLAPGYIATAMTEELSDDVKDGMLTKIPAGRMGDPAEIAAGVVYLASDEAQYVTGQTLHINGGMAMI
ncbi:3-oxoacyl-(acyl-carrier-protein) reductase [Candidatus Terasakiella magnetica]|uniref:3-oxoacyl-[acyl-carrier-protein] reductase n=1 Tax=Candidatus Terasakiella magnetica TaxID=1867952 RepID=A0A1C3RJW1_9PROT|nr:3-oxoacyl-[acyl-carrier-protein] reductase [Candidatus Terasakiella magnetica]SCA57555.1 3-oxoacyl-(acyl-carrier-protein) reductase [Candidatus Terasakiella magnetica]